MATLTAGTSTPPVTSTRTATGPFTAGSTVLPEFPHHTETTRDTTVNPLLSDSALDDRLVQSRDTVGKIHVSKSRLDERPGKTRRNDIPVQILYGTFIPSAYFRRVSGTVVDTKGEPITDATYLYARGRLPSGAPVDDDARFSIYLLKLVYDDFLLVGESGRENPDYVWYQPVDVRIGPRDDNVELVFAPEEITGLVVGGGSDFGGMLG